MKGIRLLIYLFLCSPLFLLIPFTIEFNHIQLHQNQQPIFFAKNVQVRFQLIEVLLGKIVIKEISITEGELFKVPSSDKPLEIHWPNLPFSFEVRKIKAPDFVIHPKIGKNSLKGHFEGNFSYTNDQDFSSQIVFFTSQESFHLSLAGDHPHQKLALSCHSQIDQGNLYFQVTGTLKQWNQFFNCSRTGFEDISGKMLARFKTPVLFKDRCLLRN